MRVLKQEFRKYIVFSILGMLGSSGTIFADTFFVSNRLGSEGLAALNIAISVFGLINGTGVMMGSGGAVHYTVCRSQKREKEASQIFTLAFGMAAVVGVCFVLTGLCGASQIAGMLGADPEILPLCEVYLKTVLCFGPCFVMNQLFMIFIRNDGNPKLAMGVMVAGSLANIVLDYIFIYPLNLGIFGAALATGLSPVIGLAVASLHVLTGRNRFRFEAVKVKPAGVVKLIKTGISGFINEFSSSIVLVVFNLLILEYAGNTGVAAYGIVANLALVVTAVFNGIAQGIQPLLSRAYGKAASDEIGYLYRKAMILAFSAGAAVLCFSWICTPALVSVFNSESNDILQCLAEEGVKYYFTGFLFAGCNYLTVSLFSTTEKEKRAFALSAFRGCIGIVAAAWLFSVRWGLKGVWISFPIVEAAVMTVSAEQFRKSLKIS